jgi:hypothetical protein
MVRRLLIFLTCALPLLISGCSKSEPASPLDTFKTFALASKKSDLTTMKLLLSSDSIKMLEQDAKARGLTLDDVIRQQTLFDPGQRAVEFRNQTINGNAASIEVKNAFGEWETIPFVFEDSQWKIDQKTYAQKLIENTEEKSRQLDQIIDQGRIPY